MMIVDKEKCIGCGICVKDCFPRDIEMIEGKEVVTCMIVGYQM